MATYIQRQESWALLRAYLYDTGQVRDGLVQRRAANDEEDGEGEDDEEGEGEVAEGDVEEGDVVAGDEGDNADMWYPTPTISIAKRPSLGSKTGDYLIRKHGASDLIEATKHYLAAFTHDPTTLALSRYSKFKVWSRFKLRHTCVPFYPAAKPQVDQIRASPFKYHDDGEMSRFNTFDVVLIAPDGDSEKVGLHWFQAGRVRAIFEVPRYLQELCAEKLAYVELFRPFSRSMSQPASLYTTGNMMRNHRRCSAVVPISRIRMAVHLAPRYNLLDPDQPISASTDLLSIHDSFYLNKYASYFQFDTMEYWEQRRQTQECCADNRRRYPPEANHHITMVFPPFVSSVPPVLPPPELREPWPSDWLEPWPSNWLEPWPNDGQNDCESRVIQMLEEYEAHLMQGYPLDPVRKLPKKRRRHAKDSNTRLLGARHEQRDSPPSGSGTHSNSNTTRPEYWMDYKDAESQMVEAARLASLQDFAVKSSVHDEAKIMEAARLASLQDFAMKSSTRDEANIAATPTVDPHALCSRSPTLPIEHNAHGYITARSKGKGRAD
ncbi:hypothetical protein FS749_004394 [Ceratobasidium sp. UAMH 11750]|nr:hypothetical protein FS749_004394 [Ceratobasidium sp. UAMH 11750]